MEDCFFCKCINIKDFEFENELAVARFDDFPVNKGHIEVIPKRHVKEIDKAKVIIDKKYNPDGYNIGMNLGEKAGQSIMHLHVHLIPRYDGDVKNPRGGVRGIIPDKQNY